MREIEPGAPAGAPSDRIPGQSARDLPSGPEAFTSKQDSIDLISLQTRRRDHDRVIRAWVISVRPTFRQDP